MSRRDDNVAVFKDTEELYTSDPVLKATVAASTAAQCYYPEGSRELHDYSPRRPI